MSFVLSASALAILVRAHDCPNSPVDSLFETFVSRSEGEVSDALKWYYCGGLGIALFSLAIISLSHTHRKIPHQRLRKGIPHVFPHCCLCCHHLPAKGTL